MAMTRSLLIALLAVQTWAATAAAEYLEIEASEIATIAPAVDGASASILVKWTLPSDLSGKIIDGAAVTMTLARDTDCVLDVTVYPVSKSWSAATVQWSTAWNRSGGDYSDSLPSPAVASASSGGKISANVYDAIQAQIAGLASNFGFIVVPDRNSGCRITAMTPNDNARLADAKLVIAYRTAR